MTLLKIKNQPNLMRHPFYTVLKTGIFPGNPHMNQELWSFKFVQLIPKLC